jgi:hypothetical protein
LVIVGIHHLSKTFAGDPVENPTLVFKVDQGNGTIGSTNGGTNITGATVYYAVNDTITLDAYVDCSADAWTVHIDNDGTGTYAGNGSGQFLTNTTLTLTGPLTVESHAVKGNSTLGHISGTIMVMDTAAAKAQNASAGLEGGTVYRALPSFGKLNVPIQAYLTDGTNTTVTDESQRPSSFAWNMTTNPTNSTATIEYPDRLGTRLRDIDVAGNYTLQARAGNNSAVQAVNVFVFQVQLNQTPQFIVPGCSKNSVNYTILPNAGFMADAAKVEVFDKNNALVYDDNTIPGGSGSHVVDWDGFGNAGGLNGLPLTEALSAYSINVSVTKADATSTAGQGNQKVIEWPFKWIFDDNPGAVHCWVSGIDVSTVTTDLITVQTRVIHSGGNDPFVGLSFTATEEYARVDMRLRKAGTSPPEDYLFYTTPSDKKYELVTTLLDDGAALDHAGNEFDGDFTEPGLQQTVIIKLQISAGGSVTILEHYAE